MIRNPFSINATCLNVNSTSFECKCPSNGLYYGEYCENKVNLCENVTCSSNGYCYLLQNQTQAKCKCNNGYSGETCDFESNTSKQLKTWTSTIICIICIIIFWTMVVGSDVLDYLRIGDEQIDMNEWRREKYYGKSEKDEPKKNIAYKKGEIIHFEYVN
jgi:hypothetical protein